MLPLELRDVGFIAAGQQLLSGVTARIEAGAPTCVLGPNGAGKSLTLRLAHGLLRPSSGEVRWSGQTAESGAGFRRQAMVFERPVLLRRSAVANVEYALALHRVPRAERRARAAEVLAKTGLAELAGRAARVLSAGEQQRLALARAWATEPDVLFLDEPTAALDPSATRAIEELIGRISGSGTKIIMTTHDLGQARRLAGDVLFFCCGRLLEQTAAPQFFQRPETEEARAFLQGDLVW
jgi:tungstate transport system ATP-binding protein